MMVRSFKTGVAILKWKMDGIHHIEIKTGGHVVVAEPFAGAAVSHHLKMLYAFFISDHIAISTETHYIKSMRMEHMSRSSNDPITTMAGLSSDRWQNKQTEIIARNIIRFDFRSLDILKLFDANHNCLYISAKMIDYKCSDRTVRDNVVLKQGASNNPREHEIIHFVKSNTNIPVPNVIQTWENNGEYFMLMDRVDGEPLSTVWEDYTDNQKSTIKEELRNIVQEMREIKSDYIGGIVDKNMEWRDFLISENWLTTAIPTEPMFFELRWEKAKDHIGPSSKNTIESLRKQRNIPHKFVLTHCDLNPDNIMCKNGHIVCILDWEMSGFYPEYWEYTRAISHAGYPRYWKQIMMEILPEYKLEGRIEKLIICEKMLNNEHIQDKTHYQRIIDHILSMECPNKSCKFNNVTGREKCEKCGTELAVSI